MTASRILIDLPSQSHEGQPDPSRPGIAASVLVESDAHGITFDVIGAVDAVTMLPELALRGAPAHVATVAGIDLRRDRHIHLVTRVVPQPHPAFEALETALLRVAAGMAPAGR